MSEAIKPTLLPCPFCGAAAEPSFNNIYGDMSMACCKSCGATAYAPKWNRRSDALVERVKELEEALQGLDEAYCRAGSPLTREERFEDRKRLIAARAALSKPLPNTVAEVQE